MTELRDLYTDFLQTNNFQNTRKSARIFMEFYVNDFHYMEKKDRESELKYLMGDKYFLPKPKEVQV